MKYKAHFALDPRLAKAVAAHPKIVAAEMTTALREMVEHTAGEAERRAPRRRGVLANSITGAVQGQQGIVGSRDYRAGWLEEGVTILPMGSRSRGKALAIPQTDEAARLQRRLRGLSLRNVPGLFAVYSGSKAVILSKDNSNLRWTLVPAVKIPPRYYLRNAVDASDAVYRREIERAAERVARRIFGGGG